MCSTRTCAKASGKDRNPSTEDLRGDHSVWASDRVREAPVMLGKQVGAVGVGPRRLFWRLDFTLRAVGSHERFMQ